MINEDIAVWDPELPQILTGDLNCDPDNKAIKILESSNWRDTLAETDRYTLTCHEFLGKECPGDFGICGRGRMDYIYLRGKASNVASCIIDDEKDGVYPSDHYFVFADVKIG